MFEPKQRKERKQHLSIYISKANKERLLKIKEQTGWSLAEMVERMIDKYLEGQNGN